MSTFRAFSHLALHRRGATGTGKCSAISYVKDETAFGAFYNMLGLFIHCSLLPTNHPLKEI
jgi:hypothetical protein